MEARCTEMAFLRRLRMTEDDDFWQPEGGEIVARSMLVEIDELTGPPELADSDGLMLVTQDGREITPGSLDISVETHLPAEKLAKAEEVKRFLFELSGKIAVTGKLEREDGERLVKLLAERGPVDTYRDIDVEIDLSGLRSNGGTNERSTDQLLSSADGNSPSHPS
jgi:hypothetical protein